MFVRRLDESPRNERGDGQVSHVLLAERQFESGNLSITWVEAETGSQQPIHAHARSEQVYVIVRSEGGTRSSTSQRRRRRFRRTSTAKSGRLQNVDSPAPLTQPVGSSPVRAPSLRYLLRFPSPICLPQELPPTCSLSCKKRQAKCTRARIGKSTKRSRNNTTSPVARLMRRT